MTVEKYEGGELGWNSRRPGNILQPEIHKFLFLGKCFKSSHNDTDIAM